MLARILAIFVIASGCAHAGDDPTASFLVRRETARESIAQRFNCHAAGEASRDLECSVALLSANYYPRAPQARGGKPRRCHVSSSRADGLRFTAAGPGRWVLRGAGGLCHARFETAIVVRDGQVGVTETTLGNDDYASSALCRSRGPAGTVIAYEPARHEVASPRSCTSLVIDPY